MNRTRLNGGMLNGARLVLASAVFACTAGASVEATATYIHPASASMVASATVVAQSYAVMPGESASLIGHATLVGLPTHQQAGTWIAECEATVLAYSLRSVYGAGELGGTAFATFIPASTFAYSDIVAGVELTGDATKIQPGSIAAVATASMEVGEPTLYRMAEGAVLGSVGFRVESGVNDVYDAYADPTATGGVTIQETGIVIKQVGALVPGVVDFTVQPTLHHRAKSAMTCTGVLTATGVLVKPASAQLGGEVTLTPAITYSRQALGAVTGVSTFTAEARQEHAVAGAFEANAGLTAVANRVTPAQGSGIGATVQFIAEGTVLHLASAQLVGSGGLNPIGYDNLMNAVSPERTFTRPQTMRAFVRPSSQRVFTRT